MIILEDKGLKNKMVRALFPGTFDPIHYGHIDIASRASRLFDEVVMAVYDKPLKSLMFSPEERMDLVREDLSTICLHRILADNHKHAASSDSAGGAARALHAASRAVQNREKMGEFRATSRQPTLPPVLGVS